MECNRCKSRGPAYRHRSPLAGWNQRFGDSKTCGGCGRRGDEGWSLFCFNCMLQKLAPPGLTAEPERVKNPSRARQRARKSPVDPPVNPDT